MINEYEAWLGEQIKSYADWCLKDSAAKGYPGTTKYADQNIRYMLETYQECLTKFKELKAALLVEREIAR